MPDTLTETTTETATKFRLTIYHDDDSSYLDPNEEDGLFKLHSFNTRHNSFTDPETLVGCTYEFPDGHDNEGYTCDVLPFHHEEEDHPYQGPEGFFLSYFEHGSCKWGLSGSMSGMPDFRWDGREHAGFLEVTIGKDDREWWHSKPQEEKEEIAAGFCETYTYWCNGEAYGYLIEELEPTRTCDLGFEHESEPKEEDSCWGFLGFEWFQEEVRGVTHSMGATEEATEIVDESYGSADYGRWFVTEEEAKEMDARIAENKRRVTA